MNEFERIERLARRFTPPPSPAIGIGDDCAVMPSTGLPMAVTVDASVEGVHFSRDIISLDYAAERATEAALSDLAAMGATVSYDSLGGCGILCAWTIPTNLDDWQFELLIDGVSRSAKRVGAVVLGGNLAAGPNITLTTTAIGRIEGATLRRSGARPGDKLCVTGVVGAAALGLRALGSHASEEKAFAPYVRSWRSPRARMVEGALIAKFATAAIDLSDGLSQDARHIAEASGCGLIIDLDRLPMLPDQREAAAQLGADAIELALSGGEDYELCFTASDVPSAPSDTAGWTIIGEVVEGSGISVRDASGVRPFVHRGWDHFEP